MRPIDVAFAVLVALLWGGNFVAAKFCVSYFPPFFLVALRFICVAILMLPFVKRPTWDQLVRIAPLSLLASLHFSLLFAALYYGLDIASGAVIGQLGVPFACLLGAIFLKDRIGPTHVAGIAIAFIGIAIVTGAPNILAHKLAFIIALGSAFSWSIANILVKRVQDMGHMQLLAWMSLGTVPILLALSLLFDAPWPPLAAATLPSLLGLAYTVVASTVIAYGLWYYLLAHYTVSQVAPFSLLTPIFGIAFGQVFFTESLTWHVLLGGAITIAGVGIIVVKRPKLAEIAEQV